MLEIVTVIEAFKSIQGVISAVRSSREKLKEGKAAEVEKEIDGNLEIYRKWTGNLVKYSQCLRAYKAIEDKVQDLKGIEDNLCTLLGVTADEELTKKYMNDVEVKVTFLKQMDKTNLDPVDEDQIKRLADETTGCIQRSAARLEVKDFAFIGEQIRDASRSAEKVRVTFTARMDQLIEGLTSVVKV